jgi:hypothetical protein
MDFKRNDTTGPIYSESFCDGCGSPARLISVAPLPSPPGANEIIFQCERCQIEFRRQITFETQDRQPRNEYRICCISKGQIVGVLVFLSANDEAALERARQAAAGGRGVELWEGDRLVRQFLADQD